MADILADSFKDQPLLTANAGVRRFRHRTSAVTNGNVLVFGVIPAGAVITDITLLNTASSGSTTLALGFRNADGTTTSPVDDHATLAIPGAAVLLAATSLATAARTRMGAVGLITDFIGFCLRLKKDIILIGTLGGASIATDTLIEVIVTFDFEGVK